VDKNNLNFRYMKAVDCKILVKEEKLQDEVMKEKLGGFQMTVGDGKFSTFRVISVGDQIHADLHDGDLIYTYPNAGHEITHEGEQYRVIAISEVLVVINR
jgi:co-chaperonin GroES (HSP10)